MAMLFRERGLNELYADDPERADALVFGRRTGATRRGFLGGAGLWSMGALLGGPIVFEAFMPGGLIPAALAQGAPPKLLKMDGKAELVILGDRPLVAETPAHMLDDGLRPPPLVREGRAMRSHHQSRRFARAVGTVAVVVAAALTIVSSARTAWTVEPATLDVVRRTLQGVDALASAIRTAGGGLGGGLAARALAASVPRVWPVGAIATAGGDRFRALWVMRAVGTASGVLSATQSTPADSLTFDPAASCPGLAGVCGFQVDDVALVFDRRGRFDIFEVGAVSPAASRVTPRAPLAHRYGLGAWVVAVRADRFILTGAADGSRVLSRVTWAGAVEPVVDAVAALEFTVWGTARAPERESDRVFPEPASLPARAGAGCSASTVSSRCCCWAWMRRGMGVA